MNAPANIEAEQAVLGKLLLDGDSFYAFGEALAPEDFSEALHAEIFTAIRGAVSSGKGVSPVLIANMLPEAVRNVFDEVGGLVYLSKLASSSFAVGTPGDYADLVKDTALRRALQTAGGRIHQLSQEKDERAETLLERAQVEIDRIADLQREQEPIRSAAYYAREALQLTDDASATEGLSGITLGVESLDHLTGGMKPGDLVVAAGRPGMGKSAFASEIALAAARSGVGVLFFSFEMQGAPIAMRMLSSLSHRAGISPFAYDEALRGNLTPMERQAMSAAERDLGALPIDFRVKRGLTVSKLRLDCRRQRRIRDASGRKLGLIIIDYLQLLRPENTYRGNRTQEVTEITSDLKTLAGDLGLPVLALAQLNREVEKRENKRPMLSDLRESGSIEQDADVVLLLHRPEYYLNKERPDDNDHEELATWTDKISKVRNRFEVIVAKQRNGREGTAKAWCNMAYSAIRDVA